MARNFSFLKNKRFWFFALVILVIVFAVFATMFLIWPQALDVIPEDSSDEAMLNIRQPSTGIFLPKAHTWHREGFSVTIGDTDFGPGLQDYIPNKQGCEYIIQDLGTEQGIQGFRPCEEAEIFVPVGEGQVCSSSSKHGFSQGICRVSTKANDKEGNESGWKSRDYYIDLEVPLIVNSGLRIFILAPAQGQSLEAEISDNSHIAGCSLFVDGEISPSLVSINPPSCDNGATCKISAVFSSQEPGEHQALFVCADTAGNVGAGEPFTFTVFVNQSPEIVSCEVAPTHGDTSTNFQFSALVQDSENDPLSFQWDMGDGVILYRADPSYRYLAKGTYRPQLLLKDIEGKVATCATAWVVVKGE